MSRRGSGPRARTYGFQTQLAESMARVGTVFASSLGPFGSRKAILDGNHDMAFAKDGLSIASTQPGSGFAAKVALEIAETMMVRCGDGTSSAVVLACSLMGRAASLMADGVHPNTISSGYGMAVDGCLRCLEKVATVEKADRSTISRLERTCLGTKLKKKEARRMAELVSGTIIKTASKHGSLEKTDIQDINVVGLVAGTGDRGEIIEGVLLDKAPAAIGMPQRLDCVKVAIVDSLELNDSPLNITMVLSRPDSLGAMVEEETAVLNSFISKLEALRANFIVCKGGIDDQVERGFAHNGMLAIKGLKDEEVRVVERATGGILTPFSSLSISELGVAERVELKGEVEGGIEIIGAGKASASIVMRGGNKALLEADVRAVKTSLRLISCFFEDKRIVAGGGAVEAELRAAVKEAAKRVCRKERVAMDAFADALMATSQALSRNAGLNPTEAVSKLIAAHTLGNELASLDLTHGGLANAFQAGIVEPFLLKKQAIISAGAAAQSLLTCDEALASARHQADA
jgi:chaperonin GroEL (HSP60 family)